MFSKLRSLKPFPEFEELNEAVRGLIFPNDEDCSTKNDFSGPKFRQFAECQGEMAPILLELIGKYRELLSTKRLTVQDNIELKRSIQPLQPLNERMRDDKKKLNDLKATHEKSEKAYSAAEQKFNTLNAKSPDAANTQKAEKEMNSLKEKLDTAEKELNDFENQFKEKHLEYKKRLMTILLESLSVWARNRKANIEKYIPVSEIMEAKAHEIASPDPQVDQLREELEQLRAASD